MESDDKTVESQREKLIILALIGGSIGAMIGMIVFHHKTRNGILD